jgi:hypothetical protein
VTAEGPTGAPLRQQIAEAIRSSFDEWQRGFDPLSDGPQMPDHVADAVVALLNLTEERTEWAFADEPEDDRTVYNVRGDIHEQAADEGTSVLQRVVRVYTGPWLPSTPPDTSSPETT